MTASASATTGQNRNRQSFTDIGAISTSNTVAFSFDFFDSAPTASPQRNYANLQDTTAPSATNQLVSMGLNSNQTGANSGGQFYMARILGYSPAAVDPDGGAGEAGTLGSGAYFKLNDFGVGTRSAGWHNLKVLISSNDGIGTDYAFYVDGLLAERVNDVGTATSLRDYDNIAIGSGVSNGSTDAGFDNMRLETGVALPEPTTLAALGASALLASRRRRA